MSDQTSNPNSGDSSLSLDQAATAIEKLLSPKESKDQPKEKVREKVVSEVEPTEVVEDAEEDSQEQPTEVAPEATEDADDDEFLFGEEKVKAAQLKEWRENGLRQQDYTKKTQELANARKEWESQKAKEEAEFRAQWTERLAHYGDIAINELKPFEGMDWDKLRQEDPYQYQIQWADYQRAERRALKAREDIQKALVEETGKQEQARAQLLQQQANEAKKLLPDLADPVKAEALIGKMTTYLKGEGFSPEEMSSITDAKALKVIHDAMLYRQLKSGAKDATSKKVVAVSKVVKPGSPQTARENRSERSSKEIGTLSNKLRQSGSLRDAATLISKLR
jgi:hypothetical protein